MHGAELGPPAEAERFVAREADGVGGLKVDGHPLRINGVMLS